MPEESIAPEQDPRPEGEIAESPLQGTTPESPLSIEKRLEQKEVLSPDGGKKYEKLLEHVGGTATTSNDTSDDAASVDALQSEEEKVKKLLDLAMTKGLPHAVSVARKMKDYYVLDRMHDDLVDKLYDELVAKGIVHKG